MKFHVGKCYAELLCEQTHMIRDAFVRVYDTLSTIIQESFIVIPHGKVNRILLLTCVLAKVS